MEWYDFALYGAAAALFINRLYFPSVSPAIGSLAAFATFAVGFFARPVGGLVVAHFGDRIGRKPALVFTVAIMGASTVLIGLLPGYDTIGIWAPILLVVLRLLQGFGAGAELAGAITYIAEYTPPRRRAFFTSIPNACTAVGLAMAVGLYAILGALLTDAQMLSWGWRLPFIASALIVFVAVYIRQRLHETPAFAAELRKVGTATRLPLAQVLRERGRNVLLGFLSVTGHNANAYILNAFALGYITSTLHLSRGLALVALLAAAAAGIVMTPLFGMLADRIGRKPVFIGGAVFVAAYCVPVLHPVADGVASGGGGRHDARLWHRLRRHVRRAGRVPGRVVRDAVPLHGDRRGTGDEQRADCRADPLRGERAGCGGKRAALAGGVVYHRLPGGHGGQRFPCRAP